MAINLEYDGKLAIITLDDEKQLNALSHQLYFRLSQLMREVAARDDVYITLLTGNGRFFSAGADMKASHVPQIGDERRHYLHHFVDVFEVAYSFSTHPKILITALNGPVVGLSAALISHSDFIYATPQAYLLTPYTSLGLVSEGGSSLAFVQRLGISKANEALMMSKRITSEELLQCGFVNKVFVDDARSGTFMKQVRNEIHERLGDHLNSESLVKVKALIRQPYRNNLNSQFVLEMLGNVDRYVAGVPQQEFQKMAAGRKRHKL
ncbi:hypothetical protein D0Z07_3051 [Hyphodiscus hymeniophilus]|uniref:3,2-trans-enoyl-CoA isomerase n=1 Tax=Hyphodiscus hymeniophilus TaxID=353542 RepID=A0A9P6VN11_9HELO|nr:hypothetical protein D0Z07_3051 [Hyphodiscus hymeniophilus]